MTEYYWQERWRLVSEELSRVKDYVANAPTVRWCDVHNSEAALHSDDCDYCQIDYYRCVSDERRCVLTLRAVVSRVLTP
jgi:hypothetical protein